MRISVFGGSRCNMETYQKAYSFFKGLDLTGHEVLTGATTGIMEAVSKAVFEKGVKTIGATLKKWENDINLYTVEKHLFDNELERVNYMLSSSDIFIVLDGDLGTFEEFFSIWLEVQYNFPKKIYLLGDKIKQTVQYLLENNILCYAKTDCLYYLDLQHNNSRIF